MLCIVSKYHLQDSKRAKKQRKKKQKENKQQQQKKKQPVMLYHTTRCQHLFVHNGLVQALLSVV